MKQCRKWIVSLSLSLALAFGMAAPAYAWTETDDFIASGHGYVDASYLVIHSTANPGATAQNHRDYWARMGNDVSMTQWVTDWTNGGAVIQVMPGDAVAWHVGNGNWKSVGIEICEATNKTDFNVGFDTAAQWAAVWLDEQGYGVSRMVSHDEARTLWGGTDHTDPISYFAKYGKSWKDFENLVQYYLDNPDKITYGDDEPSDANANDSGTQTPAKSVAQAAKDVMAGKYGNNPERVKLLEKAGYDADEVQAYVNEHYYGYSYSTSYSIAEIAYEVYLGYYGNGDYRYSALTNAGYDYYAVQDYVNSYYYGM